MSLHYLGKHEPRKLCLFSHAGYSPRPPTSSYRNEILRGGWSLGDNSEVRISSKSFKRFRSCGCRNVPFPSDLAKSTEKRPNQWEMSNFNPHTFETAYPIFIKVEPQNYLPKTSHHAIFHFDLTMWMVINLTNRQT